MGRLLTKVQRLGAGLLWLAASWAAQAHNAPGSQILLAVGENAIELEVRMPLEELQLAYGTPLAAQTALPSQRAKLESYVLAHLGLRSPTGEAWRLAITEAQVSTVDAIPDLQMRLVAEPPPGAPLRSFVLHSDAVVHQVVNHKTAVALTRDFAGGALQGPARMLGTLNFVRLELPVDLGSGSLLAGLRAATALGWEHISSGVDHLLFLLAIVLPAPLSATAGRWSGRLRGAQAAWRLAGIVTAFTVGHSLTLGLAALGWLAVPSQPVEVLIALSIVVAALHAARPLFAGKEYVIAAGFGLVHGLAFGSAVAEMGLAGRSLVLTLLGFNLGVELAQLALLALVLPPLLLLATTPWYRPARLVFATIAAAVALVWAGQRTGLWHDPFEPQVQAVAGNAHWLLVLLIVAALAARWHGKRRREIATST